MAYTIKHNLPNGYMQHEQTFGNKRDAKRDFMNTFEVFSSLHDCKLFIRDEAGKPLRGSIRIDIGGFYYYVELYKQ